MAAPVSRPTATSVKTSPLCGCGPGGGGGTKWGTGGGGGGGSPLQASAEVELARIAMAKIIAEIFFMAIFPTVDMDKDKGHNHPLL
jgi:hypothetical protein